MLADIARSDRAQQRIGNGMRQDVCVRMSLQSARVRNFHAAKDQFSSFSYPVHVVANSASNHHRLKSFISITPLEPMMLYLPFMSPRGRRSTVPPAFSTRSQPAAMSHKLIPVSMYASNRPHATDASSSAALPSTRHLRTR